MKKILMFLSMLAGTYAGAQNLIVNGEFDLNASNACGATPDGWSASTGGLQIDNNFNGGDWWVDLTDCGWGNGRWIEQAVPVNADENYQLSFDLGCWVDERFTTGGIDLYVDGQFQEHFNFEDFSGHYVVWKTFTTTVHANSDIIKLRFVAAGEPTANTPDWVDLNNRTAGNRVVAFDKVILQEKQRLGITGAQNANIAVTTYPNPFAEKVTFRINMTSNGAVNITVYDITGKRVAVPFNDSVYTSGIKEIEWNAAGLPAGVYLYQVQTPSGTARGQLVRQ